MRSAIGELLQLLAPMKSSIASRLELDSQQCAAASRKHACKVKCIMFRASAAKLTLRGATGMPPCIFPQTSL